LGYDVVFEAGFFFRSVYPPRGRGVRVRVWVRVTLTLNLTLTRGGAAVPM